MIAAHEVLPELMTLLGHSGISSEIKVALGRASGARFYRCAFQINPFEYGTRHASLQSYANEAEYNTAMVDACRRAQVEIVAVTDHFRVSSSASLITAFETAGIIVFPGFEANSSEGIHLLCLFPPKTRLSDIERHIGACSIDNHNVPSPQSSKTCEQLLELVSSLGGLSIAAHVCSASGLLTTLTGQSRARVWKSEFLLAAALPGRREEAPQNCRDILRNNDPITQRSQPLCIVNANDVSDPSRIDEPSTTTLVKMTSVSIEGLRQGFLDWESRVRLNSDTVDSEHTEIIAVGWAGGLLDGQALRLNSGLNVLVGGRGAGKSTLIESLRYTFDIAPKGEEATRAHRSIIKSVLGPGSIVSVLIRSPKPSPQYYLLERIYGQQPTVRDQGGNLVSDVAPAELIGAVEIFGQHEISELTRHPEKLAEILRRFTGRNIDASEKRQEFQDKLQRSRTAITTEMTEISNIDDALAALPGLRENLRRFATAGLEDKLVEKTSLNAESRILIAATEAASELATAGNALLPDNEPLAFLPFDDVAIPNREILEPLDEVGKELTNARRRAASYLAAVGSRAEAKIELVKTAWQPFESAANQRYLETVKVLEAEGHDPQRFVIIQNQVESLKPKEELRETKANTLKAHSDSRKLILADWEQFKAKDYRDLEQAARKVSKRLENRVRVRVRQNSDLSALERVLKGKVSGNINQPLERLRSQDALGLSDLANHIRQGAQALQNIYSFSTLGAEKVAEGGFALALEVEECELPAEAIVELNVGSDVNPNWKALDDLSTGQKATAVLLLLLLEADAPLIVDQPEDDLDNRFIADSIVPAMRIEKRRRQFIFSSHNANIPVLGDAEQIVGLTPTIDGGLERTVLEERLCGSIDVPTIKELVKDVLEGGQKAFTTRRDKYGF